MAYGTVLGAYEAEELGIDSKNLACAECLCRTGLSPVPFPFCEVQLAVPEFEGFRPSALIYPVCIIQIIYYGKDISPVASSLHMDDAPTPELHESPGADLHMCSDASR